MAANEVNIRNWFKEYIQVVKNLGIVSLEQMWSGDETGVQNVPKEDKFLGEVKKPLVNQVPVAIPPQTSHLVQALDSTPFAEFKRCWQGNLLDWLFHNKGITLSKKCFFDVLWPSFQESITVAKIQSGFRKTGVFPINFNAIDKFAPAQVIDSKENSWMLID